MDRLEEIKQAARSFMESYKKASEIFGCISHATLQVGGTVFVPMMNELGISPEISREEFGEYPYLVKYVIDELHFYFVARAKELKDLGILGDIPENISEYDCAELVEERAKNAVLIAKIARLESQLPIENEE
jgi:hypothetical protein